MKNQLTQGLLLATFILTGIHFANAQAGAKWATGGNASTAGDILGTTTNQPINFHTNNTLRMVLDATGNLRVVNLAGTSNRLLMSSSTGQLLPLAAGTASQVLYGNGTWGNLPVGTTLWSIGTNGITNTNAGQVNLNPNFSVNNNGGFTSTAFVGVGSRLLQTDALGNVSPLASGTANQVLFGNGTWGSLPTPTVAGVWNVSGNNLYTNGFVGINKSNPTAALDVVGDLKVSNNLYVGGGIIVADAMRADTLYMPPGSVVQGNTNVNGNLTIAPSKTIVAGGDIVANSKLSVTGNATFNGLLTANQGLDLGNNNGFKFTGNQSGGGTFTYGKTGGGSVPGLVTCTAAQPQSVYNHLFGGNLQIYDANSAGQYIPGGGVLNIQAWQGTSSIDASVNGTTSGNGLLINYFCGSKTEINTGVNAGNIYLGNFVNAREHVEIGNPTTPISNANNVALDINAINGKGIRFNTYNNSMALLSVDNTNFSSSPFTVYGTGQLDLGAFPSQSTGAMLRIGQGTKSNPALQLIDNSNPSNLKDFFTVMGNGYTEIKVYSANALPKPYGSSVERVFTIRDMANNKDLFTITKDGKTYAREVEISLVTNFPDYVFAKDYKLKSLPEVEQYINANHHLPNFEKGSHYESNGINVTDLLLKQQQTIEELMLYNIELEKRLKALEEKTTTDKR
jgi:hypothetical protein